MATATTTTSTTAPASTNAVKRDLKAQVEEVDE